MSALRLRLPRFAALVLLVWLFATGVAFAHTCTSTIDLDCDECCVEMKAASAWSESRAIPLDAAQPAATVPLVALAPAPAWQPAAPALRSGRSPADRGGGRSIPIVFLRLAL